MLGLARRYHELIGSPAPKMRGPHSDSPGARTATSRRAPARIGPGAGSVVSREPRRRATSWVPLAQCVQVASRAPAISASAMSKRSLAGCRRRVVSLAVGRALAASWWAWRTCDGSFPSNFYGGSGTGLGIDLGCALDHCNRLRCWAKKESAHADSRTTSSAGIETFVTAPVRRCWIRFSASSRPANGPFCRTVVSGGALWRASATSS